MDLTTTPTLPPTPFRRLTPLALLALLATAVLLPATPRVASPQDDDWRTYEREMEQVERYRDKLIRILKERKPDQTRYIIQQITGMENLLEHNFSFLSERGENRLKDQKKKYWEALREFRQRRMKDAYIPFLEGWNRHKELVKKFAEDAEDKEEEILEKLEKVVEQTERGFSAIKDGKMPAGKLLDALVPLMERSVPSMDEALDEMAEVARELLGFRSRRLMQLEQLLDKADDARDFDVDEMEDIIDALKRSIDYWERETEQFLKEYQNEFKNLLQGAKEHREYQELRDELDEVIDDFRDWCESDKGFAWEYKTLDRNLKKFAEGVHKEHEFKQSDLDRFVKLLDTVRDTCKKHRLDWPRWVTDSRKVLAEDLKGRGEVMEKLKDEFEDLRKKYEEFNKTCDSNCNQLVKMLGAVDDFEDLAKAADVNDSVEDKSEELWDRLGDEFKQVADLLKELARTRKRRALGEIVVQVIHARVAEVGKQCAEWREQLAEDEEVEGVLETYDGK